MHHSNFLHSFGHLLLILLFFVAGSAIVQALWNSILVAVCGFAAMSFWQALGLLTLGLTLSGGIIVILAMIIHAFGHHRESYRRELFQKWRSMTEDQRREFFSSRGFKVEDKN